MFSVALLLLLAAGCVKCEQLTQPASVTVQPGQRLTISCQVSYSLSSYWTAWIRQPAGKGLEWIGMRYTGGSHYKDSLKNKFSIDLDSSSKTVTLNGQNVQPEDTAVYYCASLWGLYHYFDYWGKGTMVTITTATSTGPTVFPLIQCGSGTGDMITLGCLATGFTPSSLTYAWNKNGVALTDFIQYPPVPKDNVYMGVSQIRVRRQDWDARELFQCAVTHSAGNAQASMRNDVFYKEPELRVLVSSDEENEASFSCFAKDFAPKHFEIKWLRNDAEIPNKIYEIKTPPKERTTENGTKLYSAASFLTVQATEWTEDTTFTCEFEGKGEKGPIFKNSSVTYKHTCTGPPADGCNEANVGIKITGPTMEDIFLNRKATLVCHVTVNQPSVLRIFWEDEAGKEMADASLSPNKGNKGPFSVPLEITYEEWSKGIKRYCIVEHEDCLDPLKKLYERSFGGQTQRPAVFMLPPVEHTRKDTVTLTCYVKDFFPQEVLVSWLVDDEEADSKYKFYTTNPVESNGSYSAYGQLLLSLEQWKKSDVVYSCVVYHQSLVNTTKAIVRSIGHSAFEKTNLVNLNMNIPETCKAQ